MATVTAQAWPFLVARGRRAGYRTLLMPQPFLAEGDAALLENNVQPSGVPDRPEVLNLTTRMGRAISVVHATHRLTAADLGQADDPKDEHGRPLHLLYGYVRPRGTRVEPDPADLRTARATALEVYRRFLDDEANFTTGAGQPFPLRTSLRTPAESRPAPGAAPRWRPSLRVVLAATLALLCIVFLLFTLTILGDTPTPPKPECVIEAGTTDCPTPTPTGSSTAQKRMVGGTSSARK
ncbi:hypothetical protein [Acrocarpospora macrocephala]|nr:hypothetical protein [Acrocarpospora macrocephala]